MYRTGHYGAALLTWAPFGAVLLFGGYAAAAVAGGVGVLALARIPDYDLRVPLLSHRGPTHTLAFALLVGGAVGGGLGALAGAATPAGIEPLWPVSSKNYSLDLVGADSTAGNYGLLALGVFVSATTVLVSGQSDQVLVL